MLRHVFSNASEPAGGAGGGFYRPLDVHQAYGVPLALHIPATLASAFQWAKVDPAANKPWRDGPAFNARLASLAASGIVQFTGTTFSNHILPYFPQAFTNDNVALANDFYSGIYGSVPSSQVLCPPERVLNATALEIVQGAGFGWTFADQMRHITKWFGRISALSNDGYRINQVNGAKVFVINDQASTFVFKTMTAG